LTGHRTKTFLAQQMAWNWDYACTHPWTEGYLPGCGGRGFEPSRGSVVYSSGGCPHPEMTAPISGADQGATESTVV